MKKDNKNRWLELIGWIGMFMVLIAYVLLNFQVLATDDLFYHLLNLLGSLGLLVISYVERAYQPAVLNVVWMGIAVLGLLSILL